MNDLPTQLYLARLATPLGTALLVTDEQHIVRAFDFADYETRMMRLLRLHYGSMPLGPGTAPQTLTHRITRYFAGELTALETVRRATAGTAFQRRVWAALCDIPAGTTLSYGALAERIGQPGAARAVGLANGANPIAVIVPCHRVIGANGALTGYGGGLERKQWLLAHEGAVFQ